MKSISIITVAGISFGLLNGCSSSPDKSDLTQEVVGKYASESENEFDHFRDTLEIKPTDDGRLDVTIIARWSAAKKDDPQRPNKNKVAGVWNDYGKGRTQVAELQASDTTLRITEPMDGSVTVIPVSLDEGTLSWPLNDGTEKTYNKIP
ncbi:hypothetical protein [Parapedobacter koreensis]|uniref:Uncharacterized protein n=1 Tax=Parapedobacter koreensis TaxID=332977 RepID=A0A1H7FBL1_9SPHI|nr:hypothetical protein [Parapedobacter koreensis]SEK23348.1 hypothetical protein SAMN05421740_101293 [Parapedobacter koreensis]